MLGNIHITYMLNDIETSVNIIKMILIIFCTYYTNFKITNDGLRLKLKDIFYIVIDASICVIIRYEVSYLASIICTIVITSIIFSRINMGYSILTTVVSLSINYAILSSAIIINYIINFFIGISNNYANLIIILFIHTIILIGILKIKKFKYGIVFLQKSKKNEFIDLSILNVSAIILFFIVIIVNEEIRLSMDATIGLIIISIFMFITIQKSLQLYYKQKLLVQELEQTKQDLENKTKEIEDLEAENIRISKKSHTLVHKQKSLEHKIEEMMMKTEISKEEAGEVKDRLNEIGKDLYKEKEATELSKTEIPQVDDMLKFMQSECIKNKIDFELQLKGNIHHMTNKLIAKEDLETLLADHIKNAIIAINHTENVNRSILVKLGKTDETYGLYIYDSGIEFEKETLENLGKKPSTTHKDEGGTGMGFMNTFDTLRKCNASLIIEEYNKPSKDNYTKALMIKFDNKNEFKVESYRKNENSKS